MSKQRKYLRLNELKIFKEVLYENYKNNPSMILRFLMMYEMGMRRGEVVMARVENLDAFLRPIDPTVQTGYDPQNAIGFTLLIEEGGGREGKTKSSRVLSNGKVKEGSRIIPTSQNFKRIILSYIEPLETVMKATYGQPYETVINTLNATLMRDDVKGYIIYPQGKSPEHHLSPHTINDNMKHLEKLCRLKGLKLHLHPHMLRHTFAIHYLHNSPNPSEALIRLQKILGHSSLNTTAIYLQMSMEDDIRHYDETMRAIDRAMKTTPSPVTSQGLYDATMETMYSPKKPPTDADYRRYDRIIEDTFGEDY